MFHFSAPVKNDNSRFAGIYLVRRHDRTCVQRVRQIGRQLREQLLIPHGKLGITRDAR